MPRLSTISLKNTHATTMKRSVRGGIDHVEKY
jgi:hypothetical protein